MLNRIRAAVAWLTLKGHNGWALLPIGIQGALIAIAFAGYAFAAAYNFQLPAGFTAVDPATWHLLFTAGAAFVVALWAVLYPIITTRLWPQVVPWLLKLLQLAVNYTTVQTSLPRMSASQTAPYRESRAIAVWIKAA